MSELPQIDLPRIRQHAGAQHRGFEEFAYVLAWDLEGLDAGTEIERRSTPDGGIEFSCIPAGRGNGGRWAWQAKYLFRFDDSAVAQMTKSVKSALKNTPDLERYIFVLPKDRTPTGEKKWNAAVKEWKKAAKQHGLEVDFQFRGESQLIAAATNDRHAGAIRYFFDEQFLTRDFMKSQVDRAVLDLGQRYIPQAHVETEARTVIDAVCRGPRFTGSLKGILEGPARARPFVDLTPSRDVAVVETFKRVDELLSTWLDLASGSIERIGEPGELVLRRLKTAASELLRGVQEEQSTLGEALKELDGDTQQDPAATRTTEPVSSDDEAARAQDRDRASRRQVIERADSALWRLRSSVDRILSYLASDDARASIDGSVLVVGEAGCGKSHLMADLAVERIQDDLPTFLVLGQHLAEGPVDPQIAQLLGLGGASLADVLQALDVSARIRRRGRALLIVDAINEGAGADLWEHQLAGFVAEVAKFDWVALVITIRDVYESSIAPNGTPPPMLRSVHPGLAGHEEEALHQYAAMSNLRLPDVPLLLPEMSNPLLLRSMCKGVEGRGLTEIPRDAGSLVWIFSGLIDWVEQTLSHRSRLDYPEWEQKAHKATRALAAAMIDAGSEVLPATEATAICQAIHQSIRHSKSLFNGLVVEGVLLQERVETENGRADTVRFTYQRLSDHLRAEVLLERNTSNTDLAAAVRSLAQHPRRWRMAGVIGALVLLVPETRGKELATVLRLGDRVVDRWTVSDDPGDWLRGQVQDAFLDTLVWRNPATFTPKSRALLERYLQAGLVETYEWLRIIASLACVPNHPLNADWLHPILWRMDLASRDEHWSKDLLWVYVDDSNPIERTIDWAWANPDAAEDVARLASVFLAWLFTSPHRRLRDTATKALVSVTMTHPQVLTDLVNKFSKVNDAYVLDRVVASAYGHILRRRHRVESQQDLEALRRLSVAVFDAVFASAPGTTHLTLRHHARMCAEVVDQLCRDAGGELGRDVNLARPPYKSDWPIKAPTARQLARAFGREYTGYLGSATEVDWRFEEDLERHALRGLILPDQEAVRAQRTRQLKREIDKQLALLVDETATNRKTRVSSRAERLLALAPSRTVDVRLGWTAFEASLPQATKEHARKLQNLAGRLHQLKSAVLHPDGDLCVRWIAARVIDLGWTKARFGQSDRQVDRSQNGGAHERIGKKYERIAFEELMGVLTDHCTLHQPWGDRTTAYEGPWQFSATRAIDASLLLRGDEPQADTPAARLRDIRLRDESTATWWRTHRDHHLTDTGTDDQWLSDTSDIPGPASLLRCTDPHGHRWLALERHQEWKFEDSTEVDVRHRPARRVLWVQSQAYLVRANDEALAVWAANRNWMGLNDLATPVNMQVGDIGEYPDLAGWRSELDLSDRERRWDADDPGLDALPFGWQYANVAGTSGVPYALATSGCYVEGERDFAAVDTPPALMPSRTMLTLLKARWSGGLTDDAGIGLGPVEREYSWTRGHEVVAFCSAERDYGGMKVLWAREDVLHTVLTSAGLGLWSSVLGEKIYWTGSQPSSDRAETFSAVRLAPEMPLVWGFTVERDIGSEGGDRGGRRRLLAERAPGVEETAMSIRRR